MYDLTDEENNYNYSPNDLAELSINDPKKYRRIVESNLQEGDTIQQWEQRNMDYVQGKSSTRNYNH